MMAAGEMDDVIAQGGTICGFYGRRVNNRRCIRITKSCQAALDPAEGVRGGALGAGAGRRGFLAGAGGTRYNDGVALNHHLQERLQP